MKKVVTLLFHLVASAQLFGQVLIDAHQIGGKTEDVIRESAMDRSGNLYMSGYFRLSGTFTREIMIFGRVFDIDEVGTTYSDYVEFLVKVDRNNQVKWVKKLPHQWISAITTDEEDNVYVAGSNRWDQTGFLRKYDPNGNIVWEKESSVESIHDVDLIIDDNGNIYMAGTAQGWTFFDIELNKGTWTSNAHDFLIKFDGDGNVVWSLGSEPGYYTYASTLAFDREGNILMGGRFQYEMKFDGHHLHIGDYIYNSYLANITPEGALNWIRSFGSRSSETHLTDVQIDPDGNIFITGSFQGPGKFQHLEPQGHSYHDIFLARLDPQGDIRWLRTTGTPGFDRGYQILVDREMIYLTGVLAGSIEIDASKPQVSGMMNFVARFDKEDGSASWFKPLGNNTFGSPETWSLYSHPMAIHKIGDRQFRLTGSFTDRLDSYDQQLKLIGGKRDIFAGILIDTLHSPVGPQVAGKVFARINSGCGPEQPGLGGIVIKAEPGPFYGVTNISGNYSLNLRPGNYQISQVLPRRNGYFIEEVCAPSTNVSIPSWTAVISPINFGNNVGSSSFLTLDIASTPFRRCFEGTTTIRYCNEGMAEANNVKLVVSMPEYIDAISASTPWTEKNGDTLVFNPGVVPPGFCGQIEIIHSVRCGDESIRGLTQCITASLSPVNELPETPDWDHSHIRIKGKCMNDNYARFTLTNAGPGNMKDSAAYRIIMNDRLVATEKYRIPSGDSLVVQVPSFGLTVRLEADVTEFSPQPPPSAFVENCGAMPYRVATNRGFVNAFAQPDEQVEIETHCGEILDSFDPNDKAGIPAGITAMHRINGEQSLEYLIRFQNTGTAEAVNIIIRDRIDPSLDLSTLETGIGSHPYTFKIEGEGQAELVWTFKNILLPDSNTNEPGSHGFVKFKIRPKEGLPRETRIVNQAAIYFDFNSPVLTNEVFNTIGLPEETPDGKLAIQNCRNALSPDAGPDRVVHVCGDKEVFLELPEGLAHGHLEMIDKQLTFSHAENGEFVIKDLPVGDHELTYRLTFCDETDESVISIHKQPIPAEPVTSREVAHCVDAGEGIILNATGENVHWYADSDLKTLMAVGNELTVDSSAEYYLTAEEGSCVSTPVVTKVILSSKPSLPVAMEHYGCVNFDVLLNVTGENIHWFETPAANVPIATGPQLKRIFSTPGTHIFFVESRNDNCNSDRVAVPVSIRAFEGNGWSITNVITPNADNMNDHFYLEEHPDLECLGQFTGVRITNRFGKEVFTSNEPDFRWSAINANPGIYFYTVRFGLATYTGSVTVLK